MNMGKDKDKERREPPQPDGIDVAGVRIEALLWGKARGLGQNGGHIVAYDPVTDDELWVLKVYDVVYSGRMEEDKEDRFIASFDLTDDGLLEVTDERGQVYLVDVPQRRVVSKP
jgi:hypothetical protein